MAKKLPSILNTIEQGIWSYDLQKSKFNVLNQTMLSLLNLRPEGITSPDSWLTYIHPDDQPVVKKLRASLSEKYEMRCVYRYQPPGQNIKWILEHQVVVRDEQEVLQIEGMLSDITAQKTGEEVHARELHQKNLELEAANEELAALNEELQAANEEMHAANEELQAANEELTAANEIIKEQADTIARLSEEKINRILHSLNDVVWSVELPSNEHAYVSPAVEKIYGISIEEVLRNPFFWKDALHPDDKALKESKLSQAFAEGHAEYTYRIIRSDDTICWLYDRVRVIHDDYNNPIRIDGISTDVTQLIETQRALEKREIQLKNAQRIAKVGGWEVDFINNTLHWSDEIYNIIESTREVFTPSLENFLENVHPEDREKVVQAQTEAHLGVKPYNVEYRGVLPNGKIKIIKDMGEIVLDEVGQPIRGIGMIQDITEQKKIESKLLEITERFVLATQSAEIGIWEWNILDNSLIWDEITCGIFEVKKEEFSGSLDTWMSHLHPDTMTYAQQQVEKALQGDGNYNVELKIITATQKVKYVKSYAYVMFDEQNLPERMIGVIWDITWQKHAEEELIRYSERLDTVIGSITDGFYIVDREWKFIRVNQAFEKKNKISEAELIGKNMWEMFPNFKDTKAYTEYHHALASNVSTSFEINNPPDRWYHVSAYPSKEGLAVYFRDITQEKEIQQQIFFSEQNLDALINTPTDIIWSIDKDMKFVSANNAYKALSSSLSGRTEIKIGDPAIMETYKDPVAQRFENYYRRALSGERFAVEESVMVPEKEIRYAEVSFNPMYDKTGEVIGIGCFARDITERKKAEEEKSRLIKRLLEQNKYLEEFAFITSHNLRAPVARIMGLTGIFNRKSMQDPLNLELVNNLEKSAHLLDEVIKDIARVLDIRKQEDEIREEVFLDNIMMEVKELLAQEIEKTGAEITINFTQANQLYTIKSYLRNVLLNLVSNAIKYKKLDRPPQIAVESYYKSDFLCFSVKDNGLGIDLDKYGQQVFTLYKRFHSHTEGKGMGMYLIKSQVDALGGTIHIDSQVNEGTTVEVCLKNESSKKE